MLVLAPTLTYRAYANEHESWFDRGAGAVRPQYEGRASAEDLYAAQHGLLSLYDRHSDGSGTCYVSLLRPQVTVRPGLSMPIAGVPHGLGADLYLIDWLEQRRTGYDLAADEDLHEQGRALLDLYPVVITGTHPEYWTERMLSALTSYVESGGRLMYLGGNGFYWVTSIAPDRPHLLEVRRGPAGTGPFRSAPGEVHHSTHRGARRTLAVSRPCSPGADRRRLRSNGARRRAAVHAGSGRRPASGVPARRSPGRRADRRRGTRAGRRRRSRDRPPRLHPRDADRHDARCLGTRLPTELHTCRRGRDDSAETSIRMHSCGPTSSTSKTMPAAPFSPSARSGGARLFRRKAMTVTFRGSRATRSIGSPAGRIRTRLKRPETVR